MLMPKRINPKKRKAHRGRMRGRATGGFKIDFGEFGIQAEEPCWLSNRQIEAARISITRFMRRGGKVWIRVFPDKPFTKKPAETRMGSGKGSPEGWVAVVKPGRVIFEMAGVPEDVAKEAARRAIHKLPIDARFVTRRDFADIYTEKDLARFAIADESMEAKRLAKLGLGTDGEEEPSEVVEIVDEPIEAPIVDEPAAEESEERTGEEVSDEGA